MELLKDSVCLLSKVHLFQHKKIIVIFSALTHGVPGPEVLKQRRKKRERGTGTVPYQPNHVLSAFSSYVSCFKILRWSGGNGNGLNTNWKLIYECYPPPAPRSHTNTYRFSLFFTPLLSHGTRPLSQPKHIFVTFTQLLLKYLRQLAPGSRCVLPYVSHPLHPLRPVLFKCHWRICNIFNKLCC